MPARNSAMVGCLPPREFDRVSAMMTSRTKRYGECDRPGAGSSTAASLVGARTKKALLVTAGSISVALGIVGIFVPLLPTVPFLLLAAFFYARSSRRLYDWLINQRFLGPYLYDYVTYRSVRLSVKVVTLVLLWLTLAVSMLLVPIIWVRILLLAVGCGVSIHVLALKTPVKKEPGESSGTGDGE